jgi:PST family polysaccharide transporter
MINSAIIAGLKGIINAVIAFRLLPELRCNPLLFNRDMFGELFRYGIKAQVTRLEKISTFQTDKLLISHFLNMSLVGFYQLGSLIVDKVRWLFSFLPFVVIPVASELDAYRDRKGLYDLYYRGTKYLAISAMPLFIFIFLTAPLIMLVWMGKGYENAVLVIRIFTPCYLINFLTGVASAIVLGVGKPELQMKASLVQLTFNIVLGIILIIKFGFVGALTATFISLSLGSIWFVTMFHRYMNYPLFQFAKAVLLKPLIACILPAVVISGLNYSIIFPPGRLINFCILASDTILFIAFYAFTLLKIGYLDEYDIFLGKKYADAIRNFVKSSGTRKD